MIFHFYPRTITAAHILCCLVRGGKEIILQSNRRKCDRNDSRKQSEEWNCKQRQQRMSVYMSNYRIYHNKSHSSQSVIYSRKQSGRINSENRRSETGQGGRTTRWMSVVSRDWERRDDEVTNANEVSSPVVDLDGVGRTDEPLAMQIALTVSRRFRLKLDSCQNSSSSSSSSTSRGTTSAAESPKLPDICIYIAPADGGGGRRWPRLFLWLDTSVAPRHRGTRCRLPLSSSSARTRLVECATLWRRRLIPQRNKVRLERNVNVDLSK